jgi:Protein phosphatase 2C
MVRDEVLGQRDHPERARAGATVPISAEQDTRSLPRGVQNPPPPAQAVHLPAADTTQSPHEAADRNLKDPAKAARQWPSCAPIVVGRPIPEFEPAAIDPEYKTVPYKPDSIMDGWSSSKFTVRAASIRGYDHRYNGSPRQDDLAVILHNDDRLIVAVADGVSGAKQSHIGAVIAARYATQWLDINLGPSVADVDWKGLVESTAWAIVEQAKSMLALPLLDAVSAEELVATTLSCAVLEHDGSGNMVAHVVNVGDSGAWVLSPDGFRTVEGGKEPTSDGINSSAVSALPRVPSDVKARKDVLKAGEVFLLATDGFGDPLGSGNGEVGGLFANTMIDRVPTLLEFTHVLDFSRETFDDDRTLIAVWPRAHG